MYGVEDLVQLVAAARLEVSELQIGEWHRAELLPETVQPPGPKKRGRPRLFFPEPAPKAVFSLARWRRLVNGDENARGWLWLEGFDYVVIDPDKEFAAWLEREWAGYRNTCPSLPESPNTPIDPERREAILEELDDNYTGPESEKRGVPPERLATHPALLGLFSKEEWQGLERGGFEDDPDAPPEPLLASVYEAGQSLFGLSPYSLSEMLASPANAPGIWASMGLPSLARGPIDWPCVRAIWQFVCIATNIYDAPEWGDSPEFRQWRPLASWLRKVRYHAYSHFEPWFVATVLAMVCRAVPDKQRRELVRAVEQVRREQESAAGSD